MFRLSPEQIKFIQEDRKRIKGLIDIKPSNPFASLTLAVEMQTWGQLVALHNAGFTKT